MERSDWGADLPSVENNLQEHNNIHTAVEELMSSLQEARNYEVNTHTHTYMTFTNIYFCFFLTFFFKPSFLQAQVSPNFRGSYCETLAKLEHQYCKLLVSD